MSATRSTGIRPFKHSVPRMISGSLVTSSRRRASSSELGCRCSFARQRPAHDGRLLRDNRQVGPRGRIGLPATLLPLLQGALADAIGPREFGLGHLHPLANRLDIDRLRPDLLQLDLAPLVSQDEFHSLDQVFAEGSRFFFAVVFLGILLRSFQMGRDLSQLLLLVRGQIRLDVLGVTPNQVNAGGNHNVQVDDPGAAALSFALRCPSQFPDSARSRYHIASIGMINQIDGQRLNAIRPD